MKTTKERRINKSIMHNPELSKYFWLGIVGALVVLLLIYKEQ